MTRPGDFKRKNTVFTKLRAGKRDEKGPSRVTGRKSRERSRTRMKTGLKKIQKTTIIEFNEKEPRITVTTHNTDWKNRLAAYARRWPEHCREVDDDGWGCKTFEIDKGRFCFRLTAPYSEERREVARKFAREHNLVEMS